MSTGEQNLVNELVNIKIKSEDEDDEDDAPKKLENRDELYQQAISIVVQEQRGSCSLLQRAMGKQRLPPAAHEPLPSAVQQDAVVATEGPPEDGFNWLAEATQHEARGAELLLPVDAAPRPVQHASHFLFD